MKQKEFKFREKADYIFYLSELIIDMYQKTDRLKQYQEEIDQIIDQNPDAKYIQSYIYEPISDKVNRLFQYLFNLIGDESKKAVSYRKFRKKIFKEKNNLNIPLLDLPQNETKILSEFNTFRNWGLHIPESLFIQKKEFFKMNSDFILTNMINIPISTYDYYEIQFFNELKREVKEVIDASIVILERMKKDYSVLIGTEVKIKIEKNLVKPYFFMKIVEESLNTQKG